MDVGVCLAESVVQLLRSEQSTRVVLGLERESKLIRDPFHADGNDHLLHDVEPLLIGPVRPAELGNERLRLRGDRCDDQVRELSREEGSVDDFLGRGTRFRLRLERADQREERRLLLLQDVEGRGVDGIKVRRRGRIGREDGLGSRTLVDDDPLGRGAGSASIVLVDELESLKDSIRRGGSREGEEGVGRVVSVVTGERPHQELRDVNGTALVSRSRACEDETRSCGCSGAHLSDDTSERTSFGIELEILVEERRQVSRVEVDSELRGRETRERSVSRAVSEAAEGASETAKGLT